MYFTKYKQIIDIDLSKWEATFEDWATCKISWFDEKQDTNKKISFLENKGFRVSV